MVSKYIIPTLCICSTMSLYAESKALGDIIQNAGEEQALVKPLMKKKENKASRFVFKDEYSANGIGRIEKTSSKEKSKSYNYEDKSRFKFKFNDGSQQSNLINRYGSGSMSGAPGGAQGSSGGGRR